MNDRSSTSAGWFADIGPEDVEAAIKAIRERTAEEPRYWPVEAVEAGFTDDEADYYAKLREATVESTREAVRERDRADDQQLKHSIRAMDDCERTANELAERVAEWAGSLFDDADTGVSYARELAERDPDHPTERRLVSLAERVADLDAERDDLRGFIERRAPEVAPNLTALAGPVLAARLIALAGDLETLAKKPSGTIQVLGAEDALFAHLRGQGPSPKHGVIYTHEYVRGTRPDERGSAARALAGKLSIAARIDHYSGEYNPDVEDELERRIERIRTRGDDQ
jgi:nucleolar protein 56